MVIRPSGGYVTSYGGKKAYYFSVGDTGFGMSDCNNMYCVEKDAKVPGEPSNKWILKSKAVINGEDIMLYNCTDGANFATGFSGTSGEHNNKLAAILCEDDFDLGRYLHSTGGDTDSQVSLWAYWNEWVSLSGANSVGMDTCAENDEKTYNSEYDAYIEEYEYSVTIYYFEPANESSTNYQNLILVERGTATVYEPEYMDITVTKKWEDDNNSAGKRPSSITIKLYQNGELYQTQTMTGGATAATWTYVFTNVPETVDKKEVQYSVEEVVPEGYVMTQENVYEE